MNLWIVLITLFTTTPAAELSSAQQLDDADADAIRYRGIEQLLAKFDAEADAG